MICVRLCRSELGEFVSCSARGHAGLDSCGKDIVCSAVTVLLRTAIQILAETEALDLSVNVTERGSMDFALCGRNDMARADERLSARLVCVADFLEKGIMAISADFPDNVSMETCVL